MQPILALEAKKSLEGSAGGEGGAGGAGSTGDDDDDAGSPTWADGQEPMLLGLLAEALDVPAGDILDFECSLHDTQRAAVTGAANEFLCSARLDDQATCFVATEALIDYASDAAALAADADVAVMVLYDNEEVGSDSAAGAGCPLMSEAVRRITSALSDGDGGLEDDRNAAALRSSFVLSVDMAHAVHPNYRAKHEATHAPLMNDCLLYTSPSPRDS